MTALRRVKEALPAVARTGRRLMATGATAAGTVLDCRRLRDETGAEARRERARRLMELLARVTALHGVDVEVEGRRPEGPSLLAANHLSWLDPVVLGGLTPCVPISKEAVARWPVIGAIARDLGVLFHARGDDRSGARVLRAAARALADGVSVLNFPEGTTTRGDGVLPFSPGLLWMARHTEAPIVPVAVSYDRPELAWVGDDTFLPHYLRLAARAKARARVRFGAPIHPSSFRVGADLACTVRNAVACLLAS